MRTATKRDQKRSRAIYTYAYHAHQYPQNNHRPDKYMDRSQGTDPMLVRVFIRDNARDRKNARMDSMKQKTMHKHV